MTALVTGGTGFVGANLVRELVAAGVEVRVLARPTSDRRALAGLPVEVVTGDLLEPPSLRAALAGVAVLYHVAADYRLWAPDPAVLYRVNVDGTQALLAAAEAAGVSRVVYTSSVGTLGIPKDGTPGTEATPVELADMVGDYKRSKFLAEREAAAAAARGVPVVIVNPSAPVGPWDWKPTPTGKMLVDYLRGRMVAYLDTGLNLVHVRDVARGHILAAERGRVGERYILGHAGGNLGLRAIFERLAPYTGIPAPRWRLPHGVALAAAGVMEGLARLTGREPLASRTAVRMAAKRMFFDPTKAIRELGLPQTPVDEALREAVDWFWAHGYARRRQPHERPGKTSGV
ncbi:MAG: NAD-dependent epimerase/dehydratase family protein [Candidatus Rokubacteria bacterium]|nr:NAD-dependent epimerase/dehydratase family protein [Candidatus Rokubacteria bacterium]